MKINNKIKFCWRCHGQKLWFHNLNLKKNFILRRSGVAIFADIIKLLTMSIKATFKNSRKVKKN